MATLPYPQRSTSPALSQMYLLLALQQAQEQNARREQSGGGDTATGMSDALTGLFGGGVGAETVGGSGVSASAPFGAITTSTGLPVATAGSAEAAATPVAAELGGTSVAGSAALPALAALYGGYRGGRMWENLRGERGGMKGAVSGFKEGAKPANLLAFGTLGSLGAGAGIGALSHRSPKQRERDRWADLTKDNSSAKQIKEVLDRTAKSSPNYGGRVSSDSAPDFVGANKSGQWVNNKFAQSRKVEDLMPEDVWLTQDIIRAAGNDYNTWKPEAKRELSSQALSKGMLDERKGGIYAKNDSELAKLASEIKAMFK